MEQKRDVFKAFNVAIGKIIKERRVERGWNQTELGRRVDADQSTVSEWETGKSTPSNLPRVTEVLGIAPDELRALAESVALEHDQVATAINQSALSKESREALITIYMKLLMAEVGQRVDAGR